MTLRFEPLSQGELETIHGATMRVFEDTGIRVLEPHAAALLQDAGATWDKATQTARIPEDVLKGLLSHAPRRFKLHGRAHTLVFGEGNTYFSSMGTSVQVQEDGRVRPATLKDVEDFYRLSDALPHLDHASWVVWPQDVPSHVAHLYEIIWGFKHTTKSIDGYNWTRAHAEDSVELGAIVAGGKAELAAKPMLLGYANPVSPLTLSKETTEGLLVYAKAGQPCIMPPECMAGGTAPATLAGTLVQQNAEVLASIAVAEAARPGAPTLYGSVSTIMDMRNGAVALGAAEAGLVSLGAAQLARFYHIPSRGTGGNTDALMPDYQAGAESATTLLLAGLAGFDFIYDVAGSLESSLSASFAKLVLDDDLAGMTRRVLAGFDLSEEGLAIDVIQAAGPKGTYLGHPHTLVRFRKEHFFPQTFWRGGRPAGPPASLEERARGRAAKLLAEHTVDPPLDLAIEDRLMAYLKKASRRATAAAVPAAA